MINISQHAGYRQFLLSNRQTAYAFAITDTGLTVHQHWGGLIERTEDVPAPDTVLYYRLHHHMELLRQEYPAWGGEFYTEPALKIRCADGARIATLKYHSHETSECDGAELLNVILNDPDACIEVSVQYKLFDDSSIIERNAVITNTGAETVILESALSACFHLPQIRGQYRLTHLSGRWGHEFTIGRHFLTQSKTVLENKTGLSTTHQHPYFSLDDGTATEHNGRVYFGTLLWNGNWKIALETDAYEHVSVTGGIHDFDFSWPLQAGESFTTPVFSAGISDAGFGGASRLLHSYQRNHLAPQVEVERIMPVLFNSWASMGADVCEEKLLAIAEKAVEVGAELFVVDDGWQKALGDWEPDPRKLPRGLRPIVEKVKSLGMEFGLWVEVESFECKSDLYKQHPEWAMQFPGREIYKHVREDVNRTSMLINFARQEVADFMLNALRNLVRKTGISYLKLDMNYHFTTPGWSDAPTDEQQTIWVQYARNITRVFSELKKEFPDLLIENCAAGGGRSDLSMDAVFGRINRSDNQDTLDAIKMHEGFTMLHPSKMAGGACHISTSIFGFNQRRTPLQMQAFAGMMGSLAIGENLLACEDEKRKEITALVALHKRLRHIPQHGQLYRLASLYETPYSAFEFVSHEKDEALLFVFGGSVQFQAKIPPFKLQGLIHDKLYQIGIHGKKDPAHSFYPQSESEAPAMTGRGLMEIGLQIELLGDYDCRIIHLKSEE